MNVVIYARYSSYKQTDQSIEGQLKECHAYAEKNNYTVIGEYIDEALTGTTDNRPQFLKMIEDSNKKAFNGVLVYQLDRFARKIIDSAIYEEKLKKNNVVLISARENFSKDASGGLLKGVIQAVNEYYSKELGQKVERGMKINADKFLYIGGYIPLGFIIDKNKKHTIEKETASIVQKAFTMYDNRNTIIDIQDYINNQLRLLDKRNKKGKVIQLSKGAVRNLLGNKIYIGTYTFKGTETPNVIPRIVEADLFNRIQNRLNENKHSQGRFKTKTEYILTNKLFCGHCKDLIVGVSSMSRTNTKYEYYSCNKFRKKLCNKKNVPKDFIEDLVVREARNILTDKNIQTIATSVVKLADKEKDTSTIKRLNALLKKNENAKVNLFESLKVCNIDNVRKSIFEEISKLEEERSSIENQIQIENSQTIHLEIPQVVYFLEQMRSGDTNDMKYRKMLINALINKVYLYDDFIRVIFNTQDKPFESKVPTIEEIENLVQSPDLPTNMVSYELSIINGKDISDKCIHYLDMSARFLRSYSSSASSSLSLSFLLLVLKPTSAGMRNAHKQLALCVIMIPATIAADTATQIRA